MEKKTEVALLRCHALTIFLFIIAMFLYSSIYVFRIGRSGFICVREAIILGRINGVNANKSKKKVEEEEVYKKYAMKE